jgi:Ca2+/Na+ antiporter
MIAATVWFVLGLVLLALGGDSIVRAASGLAQRFGASPFVAGLLLVAFGTRRLPSIMKITSWACAPSWSGRKNLRSAMRSAATSSTSA